MKQPNEMKYSSVFYDSDGNEIGHSDPIPLNIEHDDEEQEWINHHIQGVTDWANQSNTSTYIFFCDPDFADRITSALEVDFIVNVRYSTYMYFTNAEFTVQKRSH